MKTITGTTDFYSYEPSVLTIGKFDGIHIGHQYILSLMQKSQLKKVIFTFDTDTRDVDRVTDENRLMTNNIRRRAFSEYDIDLLIECPFVDEIRCMSKDDFLKDIIIDRLNCKELIVGSDFTFGYHAEGNVDFLRENADKFGYRLTVVEKIKYMDQDVSSTRIRKELSQGKESEVSNMLGRSYVYVNHN